MSAPQRRPRMSRAEFLAWEAEQPVKHEFVAGEVFAMVGTRRVHNVVAINLTLGLRAGIGRRPCQVYMADVKVEVAAADAVFYPDVVVTCAADDRDEYLVRKPLLVAEVLSPSTAVFDTGRKFALYQRLDSLRHYLTVDPDRMAVDHFERREDGRWTVAVLGPEHRLQIPELGVDLPVPALYEGVPADAPPPDPREKA